MKITAPFTICAILVASVLAAPVPEESLNAETETDLDASHMRPSYGYGSGYGSGYYGYSSYDGGHHNPGVATALKTAAGGGGTNTGTKANSTGGSGGGSGQPVQTKQVENKTSASKKGSNVPPAPSSPRTPVVQVAKPVSLVRAHEVPAVSPKKPAGSPSKKAALPVVPGTPKQKLAVVATVVAKSPASATKVPQATKQHSTGGAKKQKDPQQKAETVAKKASSSEKFEKMQVTSEDTTRTQGKESKGKETKVTSQNGAEDRKGEGESLMKSATENTVEKPIQKVDGVSKQLADNGSTTTNLKSGKAGPQENNSGQSSDGAAGEENVPHVEEIFKDSKKQGGVSGQEKVGGNGKESVESKATASLQLNLAKEAEGSRGVNLGVAENDAGNSMAGNSGIGASTKVGTGSGVGSGVVGNSGGGGGRGSGDRAHGHDGAYSSYGYGHSYSY
ncbi:hypothetical protein BJ165DRAFT_1402041 [Panaeolus papilionaceus]|nr:hypothetical protein BJ165DRAFT_1402041 [Panaeolus papilionaceus]